MNKVKIFCDSTADLMAAQLERFGIGVTPLYVRIGDNEYKDGVDIDPERMFKLVESGGVMPKTAAVSIEDYQKSWKPYMDEGYDIVHLTISSEMSACFQNARLAADELKGVYPVDSQNLSTGIGLLAIHAAELAAKGMSAPEIVEILCEKRAKLNVSFVLDTMEYLAKGGRCSSILSFAAGLIKLRISIEVKDGKMDVGKKYRGKMTHVLKEYVRDRLEGRSDIDTTRIFITYSPLPDEARAATKQAIEECQSFGEILESEAGCTICSHCGPGCLGILYFNK